MERIEERFKELCLKLGCHDLKSANRNQANSLARQAISYYLKQKGYKERDISKTQSRGRPVIYHQIKTFRDLLSINDLLSVEYWNKIKDV